MTLIGESGPYILHGMRTMGFLRSFPFIPYALIPTSFCKIKGIYPHNSSLSHKFTFITPSIG
jgi:hypothetical protein